MSWTPEVHIGELRPWPDSVKVVRGNGGEAMRYDMAERSSDGVERSNDGADVTCVPDDYTAKLMAEVARLEAKSDGLLKELEAEHALAEMLGLWLDDAKAENAKLRRERDTYRDLVDNMVHPDIPDQLAAENAKLRELVRDMWRFTGAACKKYPRLFDPSAPGGQMVRLNPIDAFEQRMADLGIEVDE